MNNGYLEIKNYFKQLTENSNSIKEFSGFFNRELQNIITSFDGVKNPYLALFKYQLGLDGPKQNTVAVRQIGFAVMFNNVDNEDFELQYQSIDIAEKIALQVLARIQYDNNRKDHILFNSFLKESVQILPVELSNTSFGVEVFFSLRNKQSLSLIAEDWKDINSVCD